MKHIFRWWIRTLQGGNWMSGSLLKIQQGSLHIRLNLQAEGHTADSQTKIAQWILYQEIIKFALAIGKKISKFDSLSNRMKVLFFSFFFTIYLFRHSMLTSKKVHWQYTVYGKMDMEKEQLNSAMKDIYYDQIGSDTSVKVVSIAFLLIIMLVSKLNSINLILWILLRKSFLFSLSSNICYPRPEINCGGNFLYS